MARQTLSQRSRQKAPSEKAMVHQFLGAGTRRVLRPFFGVSASDEAAIERELQARLDRNIDRDGGRSL